MNTNYSWSQFDSIINISETHTERVLLRRLEDMTVMVLHEDDLTGTTTKLAYYNPSSKRWSGYSPTNFSKWFSLIKRHPYIGPKVVRFLSPDIGIKEIVNAEKVFTCFKRRFSIKVTKLTNRAKREFDSMKSDITELF